MKRRQALAERRQLLVASASLQRTRLALALQPWRGGGNSALVWAPLVASGFRLWRLWRRRRERRDP